KRENRSRRRPERSRLFTPACRSAAAAGVHARAGVRRGVMRAAALCACLVFATLALSLFASAKDDYPNRPITLIVPYPAGGSVDPMGGFIGQKLSDALGEQVVIENRGGAGGMLGTRAAVKAAPDGYTLVMTLTGLSLGPNPGYDFRKDLAPIGL